MLRAGWREALRQNGPGSRDGYLLPDALPLWRGHASLHHARFRATDRRIVDAEARRHPDRRDRVEGNLEPDISGGSRGSAHPGPGDISFHIPLGVMVPWL